MMLLKKDVCNAKKKHFEVKAPGIANLATNTTLNGNINEIKNEIPSITNLATTAFLTNVENKMSNVSDLVKTQIMMQKYQKWQKIILPLLIIITSWVTHLMQI